MLPENFRMLSNPSRIDAKRGDHFLEPDFWPGIRNMSVTPCLNTRVAGTQAALKMCY
jgi:hypothetical protein